MAQLFDVNIPAISKHLKNIFDEGGLRPNAIVSKMEMVQFEGERLIKRNVSIYNLDMILAVGYRVKSPRGNMFRRWANSILKQYLLNGHVINKERCIAHSDNIIKINNTIDNLNERVSTLEYGFKSITSIDIFKDKIFYNGQFFEGYSFIKNLFNKAINRIIIIDSYLDYSVLEMLNDISVDISIYIASHTPISNKELSLFQANHVLNVIRTNNYHDRFIIVDNELYSVGSSIKDIGKKISMISKLESINIDDLLNRYI